MLAIALTIGIFTTGAIVTSRGMRALITDDALWVGDDVGGSPGYRSAKSRVRTGFRLELLGLLGLLALMVVLRFGA